MTQALIVTFKLSKIQNIFVSSKIPSCKAFTMSIYLCSSIYLDAVRKAIGRE